MQRDLDLLLEWSETWLLKFNIDKCHGEPTVPNTMVEINLERTKKTDLGVLITDCLQSSSHCAKAEKKAISALTLLQKSNSLMRNIL